MKTLKDFFNAVRTNFPEIALKADQIHIRRFLDDEFEFPYLWFESLSDSLNQEMVAGAAYEKHAKLFAFVADTLSKGASEIHECIDVALVENLFWDVKSVQRKPYWDNLPASLKALYIGFHGRPPV